MHEHGLAKELWPQLQAIAESNGYARVTAVDMTVGSLHGVSPDFLAHSFEHAFENTGFHGAAVTVTLVDPEQEISMAGRDEPALATGWDLMVTRMAGQRD